MFPARRWRGRRRVCRCGALRDCGGEFVFGVLVGRGEFSVREGVCAGFVNFDEVRAFFELLADYGDEFGGIVGVGGVGEDVLLRVVADGVFVAAENVDGVAADAQARAGNLAVIDGVADGGVRGAGAFGAHVALGGEAGEEVVARGERGDDGALRDGFFHGLQIFRAGMEEEVDVRVDEAGEQGGVAEVDDFRACGRDFGADFFDASPWMRISPGGDAAGLDVEQAGGVQDDRMHGGRGLLLW